MFSTGAGSEKFCEIAFLVLLREFFYGGTMAEYRRYVEVLKMPQIRKLQKVGLTEAIFLGTAIRLV